MNYILILTIFSSVLSIIGFFVSIFMNHNTRTLVLCIVSSVIFIGLSIYVQQLEKRLSRIEDIHRAASELVDQRRITFSPEGFVQAALSFLETTKDLYPDTYARAADIAKKMHESESIFSGSEAESEMVGIIYGIAILNEG